MGYTTEIRVHGARELEAAFMDLRREVLAGMKPAIMQIAQIVRREAETLSTEDISNIGVKWSRMRIGIPPLGGSVGAYIAPKSKRRQGSPRPNLAPLIGNVMREAQEGKEEELAREFTALIDEASASAGFF